LIFLHVMESDFENFNILVCGDGIDCELHLGIILLFSIFVRYNIWLMLD
jgi:hypothetical protein